MASRSPCRFGMLLLCGALGVLVSPGVSRAQMIPQGSPLMPSSDTEDKRKEGDGRAANIGEVSPVTSTNFQPTALGSRTGDSGPNIEAKERQQDNTLGRNMVLRDPPRPGEFERFVQQVAGHPVPRYGQDLLLPSSRDFAVPATATVPPEYRLNVGDKVVLYLTGAVDGTVEREIDTDGNIFLPSVGTIKLVGIRYADLRQTITAAIGREYRFFNVSVTIKSLRGIRVYVTGLANNPGAFTMNSLSSLANAVFQAGGPSSGGSFRSVKLYRNGREIGDFDLYALLRDGKRLNDAVLQNEDVLFIPPAGEQVAVLGSVQQEAVYELKRGETLADALRLAGGTNVLADPDRLILYRTGDDAAAGAQEVLLRQFSSTEAKGGDVIHVLSKGTIVQPIARQSVVVRIEGEVNRPGNYYVAPNTSLETVMEMAGGPTDRAFVYGSRLERRSVREQQRESYAEAIQQLEFALASAPLAASSSVNPGRTAAEMASAREVIELLRQREPDGRVVMKVQPDSNSFPPGLLLEQNDRLVVPARPTTVGVFGAVFRPASFMLDDHPIKLRDVLDRAGGLQRAADANRIFVVRANGDVVTRQKGMMTKNALPGDVVFVPLRMTKADVWQRIRDIASIIFQVGITAAAVNSIK